MSSRKQFNPKPHVALSAPHGGTVHHRWEWVSSHKLLVEMVAVVLGLALLLVVGYVMQTRSLAVNPAQLNAAAEYKALHSYDAIEEIRARRLVNPPLVADRNYDTLEAMRAQRLVLQGDHSYDAIEDARAVRMNALLPTADHSYDALEEMRANRNLDK